MDAEADRPLLRRLALVALMFVIGLGILGASFALLFDSALKGLPDIEPVGPGFFGAISLIALSGGYLAWRKPSNAVGWWLLAAAFFWMAFFVGVAYGTAGLVTAHGPLPSDEFIFLVSSTLWAPGLLAIGMVVFLFPTGKPVSARWNWMVPTAITVTTVIYVSGLFLPDTFIDVRVANPIGSDAGWVSLAFDVATNVLLLLGATAAVSLIVRFRRSRNVERQQMKWFFFPVMVAAIVAIVGSIRDTFDLQLISPVVDVLQVVGLAAVGFIPVTIAIAVMRYGLYELGRVVNRTIVYALLAVLLGALYTGSVLLLTTILPGSDNPVAVAASTLVAAALFNPIRKRIQQFVNRRLFRKNYDPDQTQKGLQELLQNSIHPETIANHLLHTADNALKPTRSGIWIRQ